MCALLGRSHWETALLHQTWCTASEGRCMQSLVPSGLSCSSAHICIPTPCAFNSRSFYWGSWAEVLLKWLCQGAFSSWEKTGDTLKILFPLLWLNLRAFALASLFFPYSSPRVHELLETFDMGSPAVRWHTYLCRSTDSWPAHILWGTWLRKGWDFLQFFRLFLYCGSKGWMV
jgi:hypothetical protein